MFKKQYLITKKKLRQTPQVGIELTAYWSISYVLIFAEQQIATIFRTKFSSNKARF